MTFIISQGLGDVGLRTKANAENPTVIPFTVFEYELSAETTVENTLGYIAGRHQVKKTLQTTEYTLRLTTENVTKQLRAVSQNELRRAMSSQLFPVVIKKIIPANGEIAIAELVTANLTSSGFTIENDGGAPLSKIASGNPTDAQVLVEVGTATVHTDHAGKTLIAIVDRLAAGTTALGEVEFTGQSLDTEGNMGYIWIPRLELQQKSSLSFSGGKLSLELTFTPLAYSNWDKPYMEMDDITFTDPT